MNIHLHQSFKKSYFRRIQSNHKLVSKTQERIRQFSANPQNPILKDHPLKGSHHNHRSFSVTGNVRIVYELLDHDKVLFLDIGTHPQVY